MGAEAESVPHHPLDPVAPHRSPYVLLADHQSQTGMANGVAPRQYQELGLTYLEIGTIENPLELGGVQQPLGFVKAGHQQGSCPLQQGTVSGQSGDQAMTALGATTLEDQTALGSGHAGPKTMGTLALEYAGLEGSFHV